MLTIWLKQTGWARSLIKCSAAMLILMLLASNAQALYYGLSPAALLPIGISPFEHYINKQFSFLDHLKDCQAFHVEMRNPTQPNLLISKNIFGVRDGYCRVQLLSTPVNPDVGMHTPQVMNCALSNHAITTMTTPDQYEYVRFLATNNAHSHTFTPLTPAMLAMQKNACKSVMSSDSHAA